jgi:hypothetical protein
LGTPTGNLLCTAKASLMIKPGDAVLGAGDCVDLFSLGEMLTLGMAGPIPITPFCLSLVPLIA